MRFERNGVYMYLYPMLIILVMISLSIGYSLWIDRLNIFGTVYTGELDIDFNYVCVKYLHCGCDDELSYTWDENNVNIEISDSSSHYAVVSVMEIYNDGSEYGYLNSLYLESDLEIGNKVRIYGMFFRHEKDIFFDPESYPLNLHQGWNDISPDCISLAPGESVYLVLIYVFDFDCGCHDLNGYINIGLPWSTLKCDNGGWSDNQIIELRIIS